MEKNLTDEQKKIVNNQKHKLVVSASAGSGKTFVVIEYLISLISSKQVPVEKMLVLTFTKASASEMKNRLFNAILQEKKTPFLTEQIDKIDQSDISTIDSFCEKLLKRYSSKLDVDQNFVVLDEKISLSLKNLAFNRAYEKFSMSEDEKFKQIYFAFKRNKEEIKQTIFALKNFFDSSSNGQEKLKTFLTENFYQQANDYLIKQINEKVLLAQEKINLVSQDIEAPYLSYKQVLNDFCKIKDGDVLNLFKLYQNFSFPSMPRKTNYEEDKALLNEAKEIIKSLILLAEEFACDESEREKMKENSLSKSLLCLYKSFDEIYESLKLSRSGLDFADIEKLSQKLLQEKDVLKSLQERYDYIIIDEYQDTNRLQESILKPISLGGYFVAVGDPKQSIYAFRNASREIMTGDIKDFQNGQDSDALFLKGNFRSDKNVLEFVNKVCSYVMTEKSCGIDYKNTSTLVGLAPYKINQNKAVVVDIVKEEKEEEKPLKSLYSVKEDQMEVSNKNLTEVEDIIRNIDSCLNEQIYDVKQESFRKITQGDIAVLFRGRSELMALLNEKLQERGYNVVADIKQNLNEDGQIQVIISLLKLILSENDDISLVAVLCSWFGGMSLDEIVKIRKSCPQKQFYEIYQTCQDEKIIRFKQKLSALKFDCLALGLTKALNKFFTQEKYFLFIGSLPDSSNKMLHINELFKIIKANDYDKNIPSLISHMEMVETNSSGAGQGENAITLTTVHASKGLEYPVVILAECEKDLNKIYNKNYLISNDFGLSTYLYDINSSTRNNTIQFLASKMLKKQKDFIDELMIFYVALTRAKNKLIIVGKMSDKDFDKPKTLENSKSYLDLILSAFGHNFALQVLSQGQVDFEFWQFNLVERVFSANNKLKENEEENKIFNEKILNKSSYLNFVYPDSEFCTFPYKNSVTSLNKYDENAEVQENVLFDESKECDSEKSLNREKAILTGNAYHEGLKLVDFDEVNSLEDLNCQLEKNKNLFTEGYLQLINPSVLFENIKLIKSVAGQGQVIKEQEFIMTCILNELGLSSNKQIIVQGAVDFFSLGKENVLIDYKYTGQKDEKIIISRYEKQIYLYSKAIEKAFNIKIDKKYILSLKQAKLIKID